jgi:hypothetical protein
VIALLASVALGADGPSVWGREAIGFSGWPSGLLSETMVELRTPLHRVQDSMVFNDTYAGVGAQVQVSPAFVLTGVRIALAPVDVFDVSFEGSRGWYFGNGLGAMGMSQIGQSAESLRDARADEGIATEVWSATVAPTLKARVWKIVVFDAWTVDYLSFTPPGSVQVPYLYEPLRDLVVEWQDITFEHHAGLLYEVVSGKDKPELRIGLTWRDRWAHNSQDRSGAGGLLVAGKPGVKPYIPQIVGLALWYLIDEDYGGNAMPYLAGQLRWELEHPLGKKKGG